MMATGATSETFAKSSTIPDHELNTTETTSEHVSTIPVVNGTTEKEDGKQDAETVETNINSAEVSVSGGSDTEASKTETSKIAGDEKGHLRTTSTLKKFASFKAVSVNKTFLAAKGPTAATASKLGDKTSAGTATAQATSTATLRPRLVAKSGSGLRDSSSRASPGSVGGKPGTPDGSAVWNKNRPAPPPEPKAYTDEELQQRYGIHLATRIQKDDVGGKQANWADIDDDDDDWAPDSMEWADGTKVTLPQADEPAPPAPIPVPSPALSEIVPPPEIMKPKAVASPQPSSSPTIKPSGLGSGRTGLVLKGASEKPTLVAKPPGPPAPVKSPWAPLPPMDKSAPIAIEIPNQQQQQSRFGRVDLHGFHGLPPPPAKEIAADDFSRTWREGNANTSRELFDSKSGRYEPVNDNRRGSRNDARHSLLQRPSHHDGPAEPSAAFQTHRAGGQDGGGGYGRRRTSSNVSGSSGNFMRRMSRGHDMPPPHDLLSARRGSLAALSDDPSSPGNFSPSGQNQGHRSQQNQQWQSKTSPAVSHPSPQSVHGQPVLPPAEVQVAPAFPYEDPIEEQKKIMRASRELAIKRRQEAEAKEEAERKERLRLKLEAMGPPPQKKGKKETGKDELSAPVPVQIQARTPDADDVALRAKSLSEEANSQPEDQIITSKADLTENRANGENIVTSLQDSHQLPQESKTSQNWQNNSSSGSDRFQPWAPQPAQQSSRNVWGPPTNDRTLGNGTFNQDLGGLPEMPQSSNPGPIGPPNRGNGFQRGGREQNTARPTPIAPPNRQQPTRPAPDHRVAVSPWANAEQYIREDERRKREEYAKAEAQKAELATQGHLPIDPVVKDTWRQVAINEDGRRSKILASHTTIYDDNKTSSSSLKGSEDPTTRPIFDERSILEEQELPRRRHFDSIGPQPRQSESWAAPPRGSRFFPSQDVRLESRPLEEHVIMPFDRPGSPSPPPPTMPGHPVYGESAYPQVSFPKPPPVVKLPPTVLAPIGPPKPTSFAAAVSAAPVASPIRQDNRLAHATQDIRRQEPTIAGGWQDRINTLIGRKNSPPKSHALQVDSSSKYALELPSTQYAATVSLPSSVTGDLTFDDGAVVSKPAAEECFEEQEMGSLPVVKVPATAPAAAWSLAPPPKQSSRNLGHFDIATVNLDPLKSVFAPHAVNNTLPIVIRVPGQEDTKTVIMNVPQQSHSNNRRGGGHRGSPRHGHSSRGGRGRETPGGFPSSAAPEGGRGFSKGSKPSTWNTRPQPAHR